MLSEMWTRSLFPFPSVTVVVRQCVANTRCLRAMAECRCAVACAPRCGECAWAARGSAGGGCRGMGSAGPARSPSRSRTPASRGLTCEAKGHWAIQSLLFVIFKLNGHRSSLMQRETPQHRLRAFTGKCCVCLPLRPPSGQLSTLAQCRKSVRFENEFSALSSTLFSPNCSMFGLMIFCCPLLLL